MQRMERSKYYVYKYLHFYILIKVLKQQKELGVKGITTVLGPPVHTFPPLFRQTGPYSRFELNFVKDLDITYCLAYKV